MTVASSIRESASAKRLTLWLIPTEWGEFAAAMTEQGAAAALAFPQKTRKATLDAAREAALEGHPGADFSQPVEAPEGSPLARQLRSFAVGACRYFDVPIALGRHSAFALAVWNATGEIPYGKRRSYAELASEIAKPGASRAVGGALGRNPVPLIIPCHRVVRADGAIGGFSGGPGWKEKLLAFEAEPSAK